MNAFAVYSEHFQHKSLLGPTVCINAMFTYH